MGGAAGDRGFVVAGRRIGDPVKMHSFAAIHLLEVRCPGAGKFRYVQPFVIIEHPIAADRDVGDLRS